MKLSAKTFKELVGTLNKEFSSKPSEILGRYTLSTRSQKDEENLGIFRNSPKKLTDFGNSDHTLDIMFLNRLVCGVCDVGRQKRQLVESSLTLTKAMYTAMAVGTASENP